MYCHQCGKEINQDACYCPYCGAPQYQNTTAPNSASTVQEDDAPSSIFAVISFFIPLAGIILYVIWQKEYPLKAKSCLKGIVSGIVLYVVVMCCFISSIGHFVVEEYETIENGELIDEEWFDEYDDGVSIDFKVETHEIDVTDIS